MSDFLCKRNGERETGDGGTEDVKKGEGEGIGKGKGKREKGKGCTGGRSCLLYIGQSMPAMEQSLEYTIPKTTHQHGHVDFPQAPNLSSGSSPSDTVHIRYNNIIMMIVL